MRELELPLLILANVINAYRLAEIREHVVFCGIDDRRERVDLLLHVIVRALGLFGISIVGAGGTNEKHILCEALAGAA